MANVNFNQFDAINEIVTFFFQSVAKLRSSVANDVGTQNTIDDGALNTIDHEIDRKTHKRDVNKHNAQDDPEVPAKVMEILKPMKPIKTTTMITTIEATTTGPTLETPNESATAPATVTTTEVPMEALTTTTTTITPIDMEIEPIYTFYYGGRPNDIADQIFFTTSESEQTTEAIQTTGPPKATSKPELIHDSTPKPRVKNAFRPSVQYDGHRTYRFDIDEHFIPMLGPQKLL